MLALDALEDLTTVFVDLAIEGVDRREHRLAQKHVVEAHGHCLQAQQAASLAGDPPHGSQGLQGEGREGVREDALLRSNGPLNTLTHNNNNKTYHSRYHHHMRKENGTCPHGMVSEHVMHGSV